jgi:P27 family predicted phage terminase small subunit
MGRPAKSNELHQLHGTKPQSKSATESVYVSGRPKFPSHLSKEARSEAKRVVKLLEERRTITSGDVAIVALYAEVYVRWVATKAQIGNDLMVEIKMKDANGAIHTTKRLNPLLKVAQADEAKLLQLTTQMGLTPSARDRVRPTKSQRTALEVIPGSMADLYPELCNDEPVAKVAKPATIFQPMPPPDYLEDEEPQPEEEQE